MSEHEIPQSPQSSYRARTPKPKPGSRVQGSSRSSRPETSDDGASSPTVVRGSSTDSKRAPGSAPAAASALPRPGDVLGDFVLEEAIGAGGMGAVFRAHDTTLDRQVALKLLPPDQAEDAEVVLRFYQEGRSAARLDHENIARVYSLGQDGPFHYIVFEYVEGETIRRRVDEHGPMPIDEAIDVTLQIAQALVHASLREVVHRDVKPSNIIITPEGKAKLVDMGLARRFERQSDRGGLTQTGMTLGTFDYISPEQARDPRDVDVRSDLYSLGCTLFHMLTGQPPFPGGTVLQKLIQHQEEEPPDVRSLNPAAPAALAKVLDKLMAKDRDRRCQSPEQLVRDLLAVAGKAGLALPHFETTAARGSDRPAWERPLVPVTLLGFALLGAGLFLWGRELADPSPPSASTEYQPLRPTRPPSASALVPPLTGAPSTAVRKFEVRPGEDLAAVIAAAPHKAVVTLTEDGPYLLSGRPTVRSDVEKDVTIRAAAGKRPVLRFASETRGSERPAAALLSFTRGTATLEGLTFEVEERALDDRVAAILLEDAGLQLKGCLFRRPSGASVGSGLPAVHSKVVALDPADGGRPPAILADLCHFDSGATAFDCEGPVDVQLRDCTFGPSGTALLLDDADADLVGPRDVSIVNSSFMAGAAPIFQVRGSPIQFQVDDCVFAPADASIPGRNLIAIDVPRNLFWHGRSNLYGRFEGFLDVVGKPASEDAVRSFERWRADFRESRSVLAATSVWSSPDPARELNVGRETPSRAFRLVSEPEGWLGAGARKGPFGVSIVEAAVPRNGGGTPAPDAMRTIVESPPAATTPLPATGGPLDGDRTASDETRLVTTAPDPVPVPLVQPPSVPAMPPMANADSFEEEDDDDPVPSFEIAATNPMPLVAEPPAEPERAPVRPLAPPASNRAASDEDVIRSVEQLRNMIAHYGDGGGVLHIAAGADLELSTIELPTGSWTFAAEPDERRPRLRFHPSPFGAAASSTWTSLFQTQGGELKLQGLDLLIEDFDQQSMSRLAAVVLAAGTRLETFDCTMSVVGPAPVRAVVAVIPGKAGVDDDPPAAVVRIRDGFLRSAGDAVVVASNQRVDCLLENSVVAADGSLLHVLGRTVPANQDSSQQLRLERALARVKGGLVHLESSADEVELAFARVEARDSILSTGADGAPLLRVDGRSRPEDLADRIRWVGENVGYHEITVYRADDAGHTGVSPKRYTRNDWTTSFLTRDVAPVFDVEFLDKRAPSRAARLLNIDALRLDPSSPLARKGPNYASIPPAPDAET